ncbi:hypothetical protein [Aequorivita vladivostokensis]|uniref:Polysaccharide chain length determinant N-terminal domain-containing protein n=1 Tax=Aequorivita vladivostokensis TaxID=171194 RepID=A0ABR5DIQ3_9FLAO|nr:hypothetical protein [Aequorivita vladivostokensis]KJJ38656.1 hypothetical protein MB09_08195 [Aequorivita vladivostokensis]MAB56805.1 hypothetical protein [Aequorivita sp.]|tara:strand:+ start:253688 stop:254650 length:963 start_codon:yes stop_codon:yes gene_type:complete
MAQHNSSEEVDLGYLLKKSNDFLKSIVRGFFMIVAFFRKFFIAIIILIIVGFIYGYYKDSNLTKSYNNEIIIIPNFETVDYLYDKVEAINNKISAGDTILLKNVLDTNYRKINSIKLEPIVDIYNFVSKSYRNYDVLRLIAEKQDFSEYIADLSTSKYYKYHRMQVSISGKESSEIIVNDLLSYLNSNEHFREYQKIYIENNQFKIKEYYGMISQIDSLLKANSTLNTSASNISINNSTDLFNLIDRKKQLLEDLVKIETESIDFELPIKKVSSDYNLEIHRFFSISNKFKYPLLLIIFFSIIFLFVNIIKRLKIYSNRE